MINEKIEFLLDNRVEINQHLRNGHWDKVFRKQFEDAVTRGLIMSLIEHFNLTFEEASIIIETHKNSLTYFYILNNYK